MSALICFACGTRPAGYPGNPWSACCRECQPEPRWRLKPTQNGCAACGRALWTLSDFDAHQVRRDGVFTGECRDPAALGLELFEGAWGTPEGNANRVRLAARLRSARSARSPVTQAGGVPALGPGEADAACDGLSHSEHGGL